MTKPKKQRKAVPKLRKGRPVLPSSGALRAWRDRLGFTITDAAEAIGCARDSFSIWEHGIRKLPKYIALACAAVAEKIPPIDQK